MIHRHLPICLLLAAIAATSAAPASAAEEKDKPPVLGVFTFGGAVTEAPMGDDFPFSTSSESFKSLLTRLQKIEKDEIVSIGSVFFQSFLSAEGALHRVTFGGEKISQNLVDDRFVVDDVD